VVGGGPEGADGGGAKQEQDREPAGDKRGIMGEAAAAAETDAPPESHRWPGEDAAETDADAAAADGEDGPYRPEGLPDHLRGKDDRETIDKLFKVAMDLRRKVGQGKDKAPETPDGYAFEAPEGVEIDLTSDANVKLMGLVAEAAHAEGLGQKAAQAFVQKIMAGLPEIAKDAGEPDPASQMPDISEELDKLGGRDKALPFLQKIDRWGRGLVERGAFDQDDYLEFQIMAGTAQGARVMNKLIEMTGEAPVPLEGSERGAAKLTPGQLQALRDDPRYETDAGFRRDVEAKFEELYG
jgi:hypothetical protein